MRRSTRRALVLAVVGTGLTGCHYTATQTTNQTPMVTIRDANGSEFKATPQKATCDHGHCMWLAMRSKRMVFGPERGIGGRSAAAYKAMIYVGSTGPADSNDPAKVDWGGEPIPTWVTCGHVWTAVTVYPGDSDFVDHDPKTGDGWHTDLLDFTSPVPSQLALQAAAFSLICHGDPLAYLTPGFVEKNGYHATVTWDDTFDVAGASPDDVWRQSPPPKLPGGWHHTDPNSKESLDEDDPGREAEEAAREGEKAARAAEAAARREEMGLD